VPAMLGHRAKCLAVGENWSGEYNTPGQPSFEFISEIILYKNLENSPYLNHELTTDPQWVNA